MKINVAAVLKDLKGEEMMNPDKTPVLLKQIMVNSLTALGPDDKNVSGDEKYKRWKLAQKIEAADGEMDLKVEDITMIKKLIGQHYMTVAVGAAYDLIEQE